MNSKSNIPINLPEITRFIRNNIKNVWAIYLFGSSINLITDKNNSGKKPRDIDIAILLSNSNSLSIDYVELWNITQDLAIYLQKHIDLINLRGASTVMQKQIIDGVRIYTDKKHKSDVEFFENYIDSAYIHLNESRKLTIDDAINKGSIYDE